MNKNLIYYPGRACRNIKYDMIETIVGFGIMKVNGEWIESVTYKGTDRFSGELKMLRNLLLN